MPTKEAGSCVAVLLCNVCGCKPRLNTDFDELDSQPDPARSDKTQNHSEAARRLYCVLCTVNCAVPRPKTTLNFLRLRFLWSQHFSNNSLFRVSIHSSFHFHFKSKSLLSFANFIHPFNLNLLNIKTY